MRNGVDNSATRHLPGCPQSTGLRLLASFESFGLVACDPTTSRYYLDVAVAAIGAPIFDAANTCVASISIAWFPDQQHSAVLDQRIASLGAPLRQTTQTISRQLGHTTGHTAWLA